MKLNFEGIDNQQYVVLKIGESRFLRCVENVPVPEM